MSLRSEVLSKYRIEDGTVLRLIFGSGDGVKDVFLLGILLGSYIGIEDGIKYLFLL